MTDTSLSSFSELRVFIVADNLLARTGLATLLERQPGCKIIGQAGGSADLSAEIELYDPDILLYDIGWNAETMLGFLTLIQDLAISVVALVADEVDVDDAVSVLTPFDTYGLLPRESEPHLLVAALQAVASGLVVFESTLAPDPVSNVLAATDTPTENLTPREEEVLQFVAKGMTNKAIAHQLGITEHTVKFHVNAIMSKLDAQSRTEAVVRATRLGWIML